MNEMSKPVTAVSPATLARLIAVVGEKMLLGDPAEVGSQPVRDRRRERRSEPFEKRRREDAFEHADQRRAVEGRAAGREPFVETVVEEGGA